jgi:hypothetical protein
MIVIGVEDNPGNGRMKCLAVPKPMLLDAPAMDPRAIRAAQVHDAPSAVFGRLDPAMLSGQSFVVEADLTALFPPDRYGLSV